MSEDDKLEMWMIGNRSRRMLKVLKKQLSVAKKRKFKETKVPLPYLEEMIARLEARI